MFEIGYAEACAVISDYLAQFANLHVIGRTGGFRYYNMDHAIESGLDAAQMVLARMASRNAVADRERATGTGA